MTPPTCLAPQPSFRLIPSRFPPVGLFDTVATAADAEAAMALEGWTNDRLVASRLARMPRSEWVYGRPNASIVMASFLHAAPGGMRFNGPEFGAWYAAAAVVTAIFEVGHHLRREAVATDRGSLTRTFRTYAARLDGGYEDLRGRQFTHPELYDPADYRSSQTHGESLRSAGADGIVYDSVRHAGGTCAVAYRPGKVQDVTQTDHYEITAPVAGRLIARLLGSD